MLNWGTFSLTFCVKIGYYGFMLINFIACVLRISLIAVCWSFAWRYVKPTTQLMRIARAAILVVFLLVIMAVLSIPSY